MPGPVQSPKKVLEYLTNAINKLINGSNKGAIEASKKD